MDMIIVVLIWIATYRLTRLVITDTVTEKYRDKIQLLSEQKYLERHNVEETDEWQSRIAYVLSCYWCASIWIGGCVTLVTSLIYDVPAPLLVWLGSSAVTGLLAQREND